MAESNDLIRAIGRLEGKVDMVITNQDQHGVKLNSMDKRMSKVEQKAAVNGAVAGGFLSVGITLLIAGVKEVFKGHGVS